MAQAVSDKRERQKTRNMKKPIIVPIVAIMSAAGSKTALPPADDEILDSFEKHEAAFNRIYDIVADNSVGSFHYPPLYQYETALADSAPRQSNTPDDPDEETDTPVYGLSAPDRTMLDSLLAETGCGFILVDRDGPYTAGAENLSLTMQYYCHGTMRATVSKSIVYDAGLRNRKDIDKAEHTDLNKMYGKANSDTTIYKPIKGNWYIKLDVSRY